MTRSVANFASLLMMPSATPSLRYSVIFKRQNQDRVGKARIERHWGLAGLLAARLKILLEVFQVRQNRQRIRVTTLTILLERARYDFGEPDWQMRSDFAHSPNAGSEVRAVRSSTISSL